ncbi:MAG: S1 RNA-binding domain-containing protein [Deltaproteobacteria bacterium]|nr:MAG: S1 RNA-binding domain-containing protein [Deltaproteobacteria bacterium]
MKSSYTASFKDLLKESFSQEKQISPGETIQVTVLSIGKDFVSINVGNKAEGLIKTSDFISATGILKVKVGDEIKAIVESPENSMGRLLLSYKKAHKIEAWDNVLDMYKKGNPVLGVITHITKGGFAVDIGIPAFLPQSQIDIKPIRSPEKLIKKEFRFTIVSLNEISKNVILSRRFLLESEFLSKREKTLVRLKEGAIFQGHIKNITPYGAFIDIGGLDGLLHLSDISWIKSYNSREVFKLRQNITVQVLKINPETNKISLGVKQLCSNPWLNILDKYPLNSWHPGIVTKITSFGILVSLSHDVEGFIPISELSWNKPLMPPWHYAQIGQVVNVLVLQINRAAHKIILRLKKDDESPWLQIQKDYKVGDIIRGKISQVTTSGLFITVHKRAAGLLHLNNLFWTKHINPIDYFQINEQIETVVLHIDTLREQLSLGLKQLTHNPWISHILEQYPRGAILKKSISSITDNGIFIELEPGIGGFCHISQMIGEYRKTKKSLRSFKTLKIGNIMEIMISKINISTHQISLSMKAVINAKRAFYNFKLNNKLHNKKSFNDLGTLGDVLSKWNHAHNKKEKVNKNKAGVRHVLKK